MEQIKCSETSAFNNQTPGKYPKDYTQHSKYGESLKSRKYITRDPPLTCQTTLRYTDMVSSNNVL